MSTTIKSTQQTSKVLLENFPEIEKIVTKIGSGEIPTDPMPIEASDMMVILKDKSEWTSAKTFNELAEKMSKKVQTVPGVTAGFQFPVQMRFNELMTGARQDVVCKIFGENMDSLASYAKTLGALAEKVEGATELYVEQVGGMPQVVINYNRAALAKYGLNIMEVNRVVNASLAGAVAGQVSEGEKRFDLVVRVNPNLRKNLTDIENLLIQIPDGAQIPLSTIADIKETEGPNQIQRENAKRRIIVGFNIRNRDVQTIVDELRTKVEAKMKFIPGYYIEYGGTFENLTAAKNRLMIVVPIALFLIFLMLYFTFKSVKYGLLIYSAIPLSAIGGIIALWIRGMPFSISAGVGFIALFGVAVLNGIVLISEFKRLKNEGMELMEAVYTGSRIRFRSVLLTALAPSLGFIPMAFSNGSGAEVQRPLATVVIGGIISATLLTLFVLPMLYIYIENRKKRKTIITTSVGILLLSLLINNPLNAQRDTAMISLNKAFEIAQKNNKQIQIQALAEQQSKLLKRSWLTVNKANAGLELGHVNSSYNDNKISFTQGFSFPTFYLNQKKYLEENHRAEMEITKLNKLFIQSMVKKTFYQIRILNEKKNWLIFADSVYAEFEKRAINQFNQGESNVLEKTTAMLQRQQVRQDLLSINSEINTLVSEFNFILSDSNYYLPDNSEFLLKTNDDSLELAKHPVIKLNQHLLLAKQFLLKSEKDLLKPDLIFGFNNMTIMGVQTINGNDVFFDRSSRFSSVYVGISIPLFTSAQRYKQKAMATDIKRTELELTYTGDLLQHQEDLLKLDIEKQMQKLNYFTNTGLKNAEVILQAAADQYNKGEIDYLQYVMLINQSISVKSEYLSTIQSLNESIINLEFLILQN